ncbi:MAG: isoleucine--tRNA ligase, partial [Candidatus Nanoarchaeia archaeon]
FDRAGYDMHGLPTEQATQKKLGIKTKEDIEKLGVDRFIEECKKVCTDNLKDMNKVFRRIGVWMDFENAYQTITKEFMDGEWWLIKKAADTGRLYEGLRTMQWCAVSESALAKHELEYHTVTDHSIFVKFRIKGKENEYLIIWTTTPWTIPYNLAVMVNPEVDYARVKVENEYWYVAAALAGVFIGGVANKKFEIVEEMKGDALEGIEYVHPFYEELKHHYEAIKKDSPKAHTVIPSSEYVDTTAGSGLVHCAPGCGPEDYEVGYREGIPAFNNIDMKGVFPEDMGKFKGRKARKDDAEFIEDLREANALIAETPVEHDYPHDQRHHEPVIFRTTKQWFFKVEDLKDKMIKENNKIKWVPHAAFNAFDSWLKNLRDNSISKQRYWGTPLPIWRNVEDAEDYIVVGSSKELEQLSGQKVDDLHIPTVNRIDIKKEGNTYKRVEDVLDVWVDAGTASWSALDYPHTEDKFKLFPADFILEGKDQIRGWFNLLMVASAIALNKPSFKNVYMHGFIQDAQGRKMSKSMGNYILPEEVIDKYGADTLRYYMIGGANPGIDLNYNFDDVKVRHRNLAVLWNVHNFLIDLCKNNKIKPSGMKAAAIEEKYILSKLHSTIQKVTEAYDEYRLNDIPDLVEELYLALSRTYIQLVRDKAAVGSKEEKELVVSTINTVMLETIKILSPVCPFIADEIYQHLKGSDQKEESVHLFDWPNADKKLIDEKLEQAFETSGYVVQSILASREKAQLGVRWPVKEVIVVTKKDEVKKAVELLGDIIKNQTNVKSLVIKEELEAIRINVKADYSKLGPEFGETAPKIIARLSLSSPDSILDKIKKEGKYLVKTDSGDFEITEKHLLQKREVPVPYVEAEIRGGFVYLDTTRTEELDAEGFARELMRRVQALRKEAGMQKSDNIALHIVAENPKVLEPWQEAIKEKVGAEEIEISRDKPGRNYETKRSEHLKGKEFEIHFSKV